MSVSLKVIDFKNSSTSDTKLDIKDLTVSERNLSYAISWQLDRRRSGSAKTKQMWEISGTTAKPHKQKGTGRARQGSRRSVQFVGGRTCFGPIPRSFDFALPKKIFRKAVSDALRIKFSDEKVILADNIVFSKSPSSSSLSKILVSNKISSALIVHGKDSSEFLVKSSRNIKNIKTINFESINAYDLIKYEFLILEKSIVENIKVLVG